MDGLICIRNKFTAYGSSVRIESKNGLKIADLARADVFDYIEVFFNRTRCHNRLAGVSPEVLDAPQFEVQLCLPQRGNSTLSKEDTWGKNRHRAH